MVAGHEISGKCFSLQKLFLKQKPLSLDLCRREQDFQRPKCLGRIKKMHLSLVRPVVVNATFYLCYQLLDSSKSSLWQEVIISVGHFSEG